MLSVLSLLVICSAFLVDYTSGHGMLLQPVGRASRWREDNMAPTNYEDNQLFCGGFKEHYSKNNGECGICGDNYSDKTPRKHELGGEFGQGTIVRHYKNNTIPVVGRITTNHLGYYYLDICNLDESTIESETCFSKYGPLALIDGSTKLNVGTQQGDIHSEITIPEGLTCQHCVLRWTYVAGNNWGMCEDGTGKLGCGSQEMFRSCADIAIN